MVAPTWRKCGRSFSNYVSKYISYPFITASYMDFVNISMFSLYSLSSETRYFMIETRSMLVWQIKYYIIFLLCHLLNFFNYNVVPLEIYAKEKLAFATLFLPHLHLFHLIKLWVSSIWIFCNSLILVVSPWSNFWKSSFSFWINPLYFKMTSFSFFSCSNRWKSTLLSTVYYSAIFFADFVQTLKKKVFLEVGQLVLIQYLVSFLKKLRNYLSENKLNCLLLFLLRLLISSLFFVLGCFHLLFLISSSPD